MRIKNFLGCHAALVVVFLLGAIKAFSSPSLSDYAALPSVELMRISPKGDFIAFVDNSDEKQAVKVYSMKDNELIGAVKLADVLPYDMDFIDDDVLVIRAGGVRRLSWASKEIKVSTAYKFDIGKNELNPLLVLGKGIHAGQSGLGRISGVSPDKKWAFMPAYTGSDTYKDYRPEYSLMKVPLFSQRKPIIQVRGENHTEDYFVGSDGEVLAEIRYNDVNNEHEVYSYLTGKRQKIYSSIRDRRRFRAVGVTPSQDALVIEYASKRSNRTVAATMSLSDGSFSEPVFFREDADVDDYFSDVNRVVYGVSYSGLNPSYEFFDAALNTLIGDLVKELEGTSVHLLDMTDDQSKLIIMLEGSYAPQQYYLLDKKKRLQLLASARPNFQEDDVHPVAKMTFAARDGLQVPTLITIPKEHLESMKNLPAVILPHGGPASNDAIGFDWLAQAIAAQGILVIQPQFRGSTGFGYSHYAAGVGEWGRKMQDDLTDAVKFMAGKGYIDPARVCIVGASYGGYAALAGAAFTPELYQCAISVNGLSDLSYMIARTKRKYGNDSEQVSYWERVIAVPEKDEKEYLVSRSPAAYAAQVKAPVLLLHANRDRVVDISQSKTMYSALKKLDKDVEFVKLKGEDHYLSKAATRLQAAKAIVKYLNQHLLTKRVVEGAVSQK